MKLFGIILAALGLLLAAPLAAQQREVPYWASIQWAEVNMRVGPSENYPIEWVYKRKGLPLKVVRVVDGWRLVQDPDGAQGWVIARSLTLQRGAIVIGDDVAEMRAEPNASSALRWKAQPGVTGKLGECEAGWCDFDVMGRRGWIQAERIWGAGEPSAE